MENFKDIFADSFKTMDYFNENVLEKIFGKQNCDFGESEEYIKDDSDRKLADDANILSLTKVGSIETNEHPIDVFEAVMKDNCKIARSRVGIQALVRRKLGQFLNAFIIFHYQKPKDRSWRFSYLFKEGRQKDITNPKRFTYLFGNNYSGRTANERFNTLVGKVDIYGNSLITEKDLIDAFSIEALSNEFFRKYTEIYELFRDFATDKNNYPNYFDFADKEGKYVRDYVKKMLGRLVFLQFVQRKGWLKNEKGHPDYFFMQNLFNNCSKEDKEDFLDRVLEPLFFAMLNTLDAYRKSAFEKHNSNKDSAVKWDTKWLNQWTGLASIPYLNGGLFEQDELDKRRSKFKAEHFERLFNLFSEYNFTIDENDPDDAEVGIDPEMLGRIFENELEDNKDKGAYYTPKEIVQYMCSEALINTIESSFDKDTINGKIRKFIKTQSTDELSGNEAAKLLDILQKIRICDPAIGSGAFPMGLLNILFRCRIALGDNKIKDHSTIKREIIKNNIYGVDIEKGAVDIARLRFWLSLVVDEEFPKPLPNLDFKIMQGHSLVESVDGADLSDILESNTQNTALQTTIFDPKVNPIKRELKKLTHLYFQCELHEQREYLREQISALIKQQMEIQQIRFPKDIELFGNSDLFLWHTWFAEVFDNGGFDIVIGNPPYLKEGRASKEIFDKIKHTPYYFNKMDLWYAFGCKGIDLLKNKGVLCFIATNNWTTNSGASKLRNKVISDTKILQMCDFGDARIFESASIQTMIMMFQKDSETDGYTFDHRHLFIDSTYGDAMDLLIKKPTIQTSFITPTIKRSEFNVNKRNKNKVKFLTFSANESIFDKIMENEVVYLSDKEDKNAKIQKEISQGIVFPQDVLNKQNQKILGDGFYENQGIFALTKEELTAMDLSEKEKTLIKPFYTTEQIKRFYSNPNNDIWIIYTGSEFKKIHSMDNYPKLKKHLDRFQSILTSSNKPYGLHRSREQYIFEGEKILAQRKCARPIFSYSDFDCYVSQTFNIIQTKRCNMKFLTGLLNSKLVKYWLKYKGKMQGMNYQLDTEPLTSIPLVIPTKDRQETVAKLVDFIISLHKNPERKISEYVDNSYVQTVLEDIIDAVIFEMYFSKEFVAKNLHIYDKLQEIMCDDVAEFYKRRFRSALESDIKRMEVDLKSLLLPIISN